MNLDEIKELLKMVTDTDVTEFEYESGDHKIRIRRGDDSREAGRQAPIVVLPSSIPGSAAPVGEVAAPPPAQPAGDSAKPEAAAPPEEEEEDLVMVSSPIVGTFYEAPSPEAPAFVQVGDKVSPGQVLCIIEAMKLMNEIEAETSGVIVKRFVSNAQPVEYGEALFALRPD